MAHKESKNKDKMPCLINMVNIVSYSFSNIEYQRILHQIAREMLEDPELIDFMKKEENKGKNSRKIIRKKLVEVNI